MAQAREMQRAKALEDRQRMLALVKSKGYRTPEEYNAAKAEEFMRKGKPTAQFTAAAHRVKEQ